MSFTNFLAKALLDHLFTDPAYTAPANIFVGLSSSTPDEAGANFTEEGAGGYARVSTAASDWDAATAADPSVKDNATEIAFPQASADWLSAVPLTHFGLFDASSGGNLLAFGALSVARPILSGDTAKFPIGDLDITLD